MTNKKLQRYVYLGPLSGATLADGTEVMLHPNKDVDLDPEDLYVKRLVRRRLLVPSEGRDKLRAERRAARKKHLAERKKSEQGSGGSPDGNNNPGGSDPGNGDGDNKKGKNK